MSLWTERLALPDLLPLAVVNAYWFGGLAVFAVYAALRGTPRSPRLDKLSRSAVVPRFILEYGLWQLRFHVRVLRRLGFTPDLITLLSLLFAVVGAVLIASGRMGLGGWSMFLAFICDAYDGMLARELGLSSARGEFLDSVIDRYADAVIGLGFLYYYRDDPVGAAACGAYLVGSSVMGYAKAKGELNGVDPNVGIMQRHERAVYLGGSTVLAPFVAALLEPGAAHPRYHLVLVALVLVAFFTNVTAVWRTVYVMRRMPRPSAPAPSVDPAVAGAGASASASGESAPPQAKEALRS